jgi:DNA helicase-2/ATP-dependent DNA helicase PcrA
MDLLSDLTGPQREAVAHVDGPLLVIAGAGSGKTRVITSRIAHLVERGIPASAILAITFTNKAAGEMRDRVYSLFDGEELRGMWITTFHSMCARILRREAALIGYSPDYTIYDTNDQERLLKRVLVEINLDTSTFRPAAILARISAAKNELLTPETYKCPGMPFFAEAVEKAFAAYQAALRASNAMDFDDLLLNTAALFRDVPEALERYQKRFRYVLVDEYQDTNHAQYVIARQLAAKHRNLCVTGDPDQSIYNWRGADITNILHFEEDFPGAKVVKLEENFRSTKRILAVADRLITHNIMRRDRGLWTKAEEGARVRSVFAPHERAEAAYIAEQISELVVGGRRYGDVACLYRVAALSRNIETALLEAGIPYAVVGSVAFYQRREIKDVLAYLRLVVNPADEVSLRRIINVPPRKIGTATEAELTRAARARSVSMLDAVRDADSLDTLKPAARKRTAAFAALMGRISEAADGPVATVVERVLEETAYKKFLGKDESTLLDRWENIRELVSAAAQHDEFQPEGGLRGFLEQVALVSDVDNWEDAEDRVSLITIHSAKGLEFPVVFIVGLEENIFPHARSLEDPAQLEEERRLCYVGVTRAEKELFLTHTQKRMQQGFSVRNTPSRFLSEMPEEHLEPIVVPDDEPPEMYSPSKSFRSTWDDDVPSIDYDTLDGSDTGGLRPGDMVIHPRFGIGKLISSTGEGENAKVRVQFQYHGKKNLSLRSAQLEKI